VFGPEDVHLERLPRRADVVAVGAGEAGREHVAGLHVFAHHGLVDWLIGAAGAAVAATRLHAVVEALDQVVQLAHVCNRPPLFLHLLWLKVIVSRDEKALKIIKIKTVLSVWADGFNYILQPFSEKH
jgi:hypothetical protein